MAANMNPEPPVPPAEAIAAGPQAQALSETAVERILEELALLTGYAARRQEHPDVLPAARKFLLQHRGARSLSVEDQSRAIELCAQLAPENGEVTVDTLRATERPRDGRVLTTPVGKYLWRLWWWAGGFVALNFAYAVIDRIAELSSGGSPGEMLTAGEYWQAVVVLLGSYLLPFTYGAVGACAYLMRITGLRLRDRSFDVRRIPEHINRIILGAISGGIIVLFIESPEGFQLGPAALGFLAGYSIDFLFNVIDRIIAAILPKSNSDPGEARAQQAKLTYVNKRVNKRLRSQPSEGEQQALEEIKAVLER